jgi:hypothetical protein
MHSSSHQALGLPPGREMQVGTGLGLIRDDPISGSNPVSLLNSITDADQCDSNYLQTSKDLVNRVGKYFELLP